MKVRVAVTNNRYLIALILALFTIIIVSPVYSQGKGKQGKRGKRGPRSGGDASLTNNPFVGITDKDGKVQPGLFKIESTGVTTKPVVEAANAFLKSLTDQQRKSTLFPVDDSEWRKWDNRHFYKRQGVGFDKMSEDQRKLAFKLMQTSLSAEGLEQTKNIMKLNGTLAELANNFEEYGQWLYWITIMGEPSESKPWGWQIDGHHLTINYFVLGDQVVMSPVFIGSEPVEAKAGEFKGTIVLQKEQNKGLALMQKLDAEQQKMATVATSKAGTNILAEAWHDNVKLDFAGIPGAKLNDNQKEQLLDLINQFVSTMDDGHAKVKMTEVKKHLDKTYFAWIGETKKDSVFYYRVHSPVVMIEFDHQRRVAPAQARNRVPGRDHIHAVVRTPNGNDYGKDLLRQHYEKHHKHDK